MRLPGAQVFRLGLEPHHQLSQASNSQRPDHGASQPPQSCEAIPRNQSLSSLPTYLPTDLSTHLSILLVLFLWKTLINTPLRMVIWLALTEACPRLACFHRLLLITRPTELAPGPRTLKTGEDSTSSLWADESWRVSRGSQVQISTCGEGAFMQDKGNVGRGPTAMKGLANSRTWNVSQEGRGGGDGGGREVRWSWGSWRGLHPAGCSDLTQVRTLILH